jgi:hypothetical protein
MKVRYVGPAGDQWVKDPNGGWLHVERGAAVDMSDALAGHLVETRPQAWELVVPEPAAKPAKKTIPEEG